jgi:hypothetical protein
MRSWLLKEVKSLLEMSGNKHKVFEKEGSKQPGDQKGNCPGYPRPAMLHSSTLYVARRDGLVSSPSPILRNTPRNSVFTMSNIGADSLLGR